MAENQQNGLMRFLSRMNPITRVREFGSNVVNHPGQTAVTTGLGLVPIAGPVLSGLARLLFQNRNNTNTNEAMTDQIRTQNENLSNQIFAPNGPSQGMARPGPSMGSMGPPGGMAGITSPWQGQSSQQSPLLQMLGIPDYANGSPGAAAPQGQSMGMGSASQSMGGSPMMGASTSLGGNGATVGSATLSGIESMLNAGVGQNNRAAMMTQSREVSQQRDQARQNGPKPPGMTAQQWFQQNS